MADTRDRKVLQGAVEDLASHTHDEMFSKDTEAQGELDAFGAQKKKVDPVEIALVRKLDLWIMVYLSDGLSNPCSCQLTTDDPRRSPCFGSCISSTF